MPKTVHIKSFGCQMNALDTALVVSALKNDGWVQTKDQSQADLVIINTCSVRRHAEEKVLSHLGNLKNQKQHNSNLIVAVMGCMAQRLGQKLLENKTVDIVCGPSQIPELTRMVNEVLGKKQEIVAVTEDIRRQTEQNQKLDDFESAFDSDDKALPNQAFVSVMRGCNNFCAYCIVPYVRGPEISRPPKVIIEQIKKLADNGVKLVTLLGQTVNSYKYTAGKKTYCLADILEMASQIEGLEWIRFVTSYPREEFFEQICKAMANLPKVCNYLHMPAQSGSDRILQKMNRHYTSGQYLGLLAKARNIVPEITIAGDFIVGFPGETDEDFGQTVELVKKADYKNAFIFKYSPRPGTLADKKLEDTVPAAVKKQRNNDLLKVQEEISDTLSRKWIGKEVRVLVEGLSKKPHLNKAQNQDNPQLIGRTAEDWIVVFNGPENLAGKFANVNIIKSSPLTLFGQILP